MLLVVPLAVTACGRVRATEPRRERIQVVGDRLLPVSHIVSGALAHHAARELDLVTQPAFTHATRRFTKVARGFRAFTSEVARHPLDVLLELLDLPCHFALPLVESLLAFSAIRAGTREIPDVTRDLTLLVRKILRPLRSVLDAARLAGLTGLFKQASRVFDLVEG